MVRAEVISVGSELLLGDTIDTNAAFLASHLSSLGVGLDWISLVGDNQARLVEVLQRAWRRSGLILVTGGLGPTGDDLTRETIAELLGEEPKIEPALEQELCHFFARRNLEMPLSNLKQAWLIPSAAALRNDRGTAPGWWVERDDRILIAMPGPPGEMESMWHSQVVPRLRQRFPAAVIISRTLKTFGLGEARVGELVSSLFSLSNPALGVYAKPDGIYVRLTAKGSDEGQARELIALHEPAIRSALGDYIWGVDDETLEAVVGRMLLERRLSLGVFEYGTGGLLAATLNNEFRAQEYFRGGLAMGSDEAALSQYGVNGAGTVQAMAEAARSRFQADVGIGVGGELGGIETGPSSAIYIAISAPGGARVVRSTFPGVRNQVRRRAVTAALFELRKTLLGLETKA